MNNKIKINIALASLLTIAGYHPVHAGDSGTGWGALIGAFIGAAFGDAIEEASKSTGEPSANYCIYIDKHEIKRNIKIKIEDLCTNPAHSYATRNEINNLISNITNTIDYKIDTTCYHSRIEAEQDCENYAKNMVIEHISSRAKKHAFQEGSRLKQQGLTSWHFQPHAFSQQIEQQIAREVEQSYEYNSWHALQGYWGDNLKNKIIKLAQRQRPIAQEQYYVPMPASAPEYIDCNKIEQDMISRIDRLCATHQQTPNKQNIIAHIKQRVREQLMYDIRNKEYGSNRDAHADAVQKLNSFLPEILQDYASSDNQKAHVKQRAVQALERNAPNGLKFLISDELY